MADTEIDVQVVALPQLEFSFSGGYWDAVGGLLGETNSNEKWYVNDYANIVTGENDFNWQAKQGPNYRLKKADLTFGYRHLDWNLKHRRV